MSQTIIKKASPESKVGGKLTEMALDYMKFSLAGSRESATIDKTFQQLWRARNNRFSHEYAYEAVREGKTLGMIMCYPTTLMNRLAMPTFSQLFNLHKWNLIGYNLRNWKECYTMLTLKEGENDEYHIGTIATLPESRGLGLGTELILHAEKQAVLQGFAKSSLTVKQENAGAIKLYERLGYQKVGEIIKPAVSMYRMSKLLV
ncbi:GNAT family N-acetyltransferase [Paenibacillus barcinonensis]|uniref:Acetyltransferase (GNAT) family protein n=1 Tax=Paenibacillus barcinonensis TaxID=198119 RepID=A0A2V4W691_PAEBA|nr:GNAT family N-acetyltransferase [Paenibacillus barcinonensis]PYE50337.1 acetyltransferase (GNAT) family protein [Paenibacillus barcinonensis]QKS55013.1 GNAT family N-acetyltransferase [Paenibacillus barcinonensis]